MKLENSSIILFVVVEYAKQITIQMHTQTQGKLFLFSYS